MSRSRKIGCYNDRIAPKFDRHRGSAAAEVPVNCQCDLKSLKANRLRDFVRSYGKTSVRLVKRGPGMFSQVHVEGIMMASSNGSISRVTGPLCGEFNGEFPSQRPVTWSFDVFFIYARINGWVNNREAGDLRRHRAHYDVNVMIMLHYVHIQLHIFVKQIAEPHAWKPRVIMMPIF